MVYAKVIQYIYDKARASVRSACRLGVETEDFRVNVGVH